MDDILKEMDRTQLEDIIKHVVRLTEDGVAFDALDLLQIIRDIYNQQ